jgi:hypothetical protein
MLTFFFETADNYRVKLHFSAGVNEALIDERAPSLRGDATRDDFSHSDDLPAFAHNCREAMRRARHAVAR